MNDPSTTSIYTISLHDALPIYPTNDDRAFTRNRLRHELLPAMRVMQPGIDSELAAVGERAARWRKEVDALVDQRVDRKSTRLNSSHSQISYAVFCQKK